MHVLAQEVMEMMKEVCGKETFSNAYMPWCTREWQPQGRGGGRPKPSRWVCSVEGGEAMCMYMYMHIAYDIFDLDIY